MDCLYFGPKDWVNRWFCRDRVSTIAVVTRFDRGWTHTVAGHEECSQPFCFCHSILWIVVTEPKEGISYYVILPFDVFVFEVKLLQCKLPTPHLC